MLHLLDSVPTRGYLALALLGFGCGLAGTLIGVAAVPAKPAVAPTIAVEVAEEPVDVEPPPARVHEVLPELDPQIHFVFVAGGDRYLALAPADGLSRHGKPRLANDESVYSAIASLRDVPADVRAWRGREVIVDSSCRAHVTDFALVARITGDAGYLDEDEQSNDWTAAKVLEHGTTVIAAKLDGCSGTYARAATAPEVRVFEPADADGYLQQARAQVRASMFADEAAKQWRELRMQGAWDDGNISSMAARDPRTGTIWLSVHAHAEDGCGGPDFNFLGLFRVEHDGSLTAVQLRAESLSTIQQLVDIDGDGMPELVGRGWLAPDTAFENADGDTIASFETPFVGCPC